MKHFCLISLFFFWIIPAAFSQPQTLYEIKSVIDFFNSHKLQQGDLKSVLVESDIEGSPYLSDDFVDGSLYTTSKTRYDGVAIRYNVYNEQVEIRSDDGQVLGLAVPDVIERLEFGGYQLENVAYSSAKKVKKGFLVVLEKGYASLYSGPRVQFIDTKPAGAYQDSQPAKFVKRPDEYFIKVGKDPARIISKTKDIVAQFPDHQKEVAAFIKKNKVRINQPESLKELIQYYNNQLRQ
ncbi:MAG: hypothetical protein WCY58_10950 [Mariniphaga sp.]|nr:hypothetical protein [Mariniphaga sp.]